MDSPCSESGAHHSINNLLGLLRIRVKRGINLAVRDVRSSDPYLVVKLGRQKLKTRVIRKDINPEWNEDLTLSISDDHPISLSVYDHDTFTKDDNMGDADFQVKPFIDALKTNLKALPSGTIIKTLYPSESNDLAKESAIVWRDGCIVEEMRLKLRNVECGEVELQLQWIDLPGGKA